MAFIYAHLHDPKPDADPQAVHLLSHAGYDSFHYGGLALIAIGVLLMLWAIFHGLEDAP